MAMVPHCQMATWATLVLWLPWLAVGAVGAVDVRSEGIGRSLALLPKNELKRKNNTGITMKHGSTILDVGDSSRGGLGMTIGEEETGRTILDSIFTPCRGNKLGRSDAARMSAGAHLFQCLIKHSIVNRLVEQIGTWPRVSIEEASEKLCVKERLEPPLQSHRRDHQGTIH